MFRPTKLCTTFSTRVCEVLSLEVDMSGRTLLAPCDLVEPITRKQLGEQILLPEELTDPEVEVSNLDDPVLTR